MSLRVPFPHNYSSEDRQKGITGRMNEIFEFKKCDQVMSEKSKDTPSKNTNQLTQKLDQFRRQVEDLESKHISIGSDGNEDKFLPYNDRCLKLLEQMDRLGDLKGQSSPHKQRKQLIDKIKKFQTEIRQLSIENLANLLKKVKDMDQTKGFEHLYEKVDPFLKNESESATINAVEDLRYQLEGIHQKLNKSSNV